MSETKINAKLSSRSGDFRLIKPYNSYVLKILDDFILMCFVLKDNGGSTVDYACFSIHKKSLESRVKGLINYALSLKVSDSQTSFKPSDFTNDFYKNITNIDIINSVTFGSIESEISLSSFSHNDLSSRFTTKPKDGESIDFDGQIGIALLRSSVHVNRQFLIDLTTLYRENFSSKKDG